MATVPGNPDEPTNVAQMLPKWAQPTMADFLQAAAIMDQKGRFAMDTSQMRPSTNVEDDRPVSDMGIDHPYLAKSYKLPPEERGRPEKTDLDEQGRIMSAPFYARSKRE